MEILIKVTIAFIFVYLYLRVFYAYFMRKLRHAYSI